MTRRQRIAKHHNRISLWRRVVGARPAWIISFMVTISGAVLSQWKEGMERISGLERDVSHLAAQRAELKADADAQAERLRRMIQRQCREVCKS